MTANEFCNRVLPLQDKLHRLALRYFNNHEDSVDAVQEVFYKLWLQKEKLETFRSVEAFAMVITRNHCLDKLKAKGAHHDKLETVQQPVDEQSPYRIAEQKDAAAMVSQLLDQLPELQRTVFHLRDIEGLELEEIAEILEMNAVAVRVNLSRARKFIREKLIAIQNYEYKGD